MALTIPFLLPGFLAVVRSGLSLSTLRSQLARLLVERGTTRVARG